MKKILAIFAVVIGFSSVSQAGILLEPYLGYEMGKISGDMDGKLEGTQLGLRVAWTAPLLFWAGLDATYGVSAQLKPDGAGADQDAKRTSYYGVVGVDLPVLVRGWFGYGFANELKGDFGKIEGNSTKIGVGFTGLPFVSLNLEYISEKFDKVDGSAIDLKNETYVLSVSLPLEF